MATRLIIVEGLPGTGKSTTASLIARELRERGHTVVCVDEGDPNHPADLPDYDIFDDFADERTHILARWRSFVEHADPHTIYVFNCLLLQNPMCETMMRFDMDEAASRAYIGQIARIIRPLHPLVVYLDRTDVRSTVDAVLAERGEGWLNAVIDYHTCQGYGAHLALHGYDGYIACLAERKRREMRILESLDVESFVVGQHLTAEEFGTLFASAGWAAPDRDQMDAALRHRTVTFVVRRHGRPIACLGLIGDQAMHWLVAEFIVRPEWQHRLIGQCLYRYAEQYMLSLARPDWTLCIDVRSSPQAIAFYERCGFTPMPSNGKGPGLEKLLSR
ncbi:hypothetical protein CQR46_0243 [Bifidobacterium pseudolongum subsp. globosum]|uniref:N-acetyltransferase domain-containing protein n=1 Tax=Bifidobacterium pseudolongum subsp. globosum TaxID=1690 RepID=A0A2N3QKE2_9BIFI|nr:GNAT family N-acetyltransferase [Bifidobacterium pseudolongum]PKU92163.1 hypothetical protein CQR46_0243 [Bifidobacterium pseudolongum subsp. globosum]